MKIGFQGDIGSNAEYAAQKLIKKFNLKEACLIPLTTSQNVVAALSKQNIDYGVMATKNSLAGDVTETTNALTDNIELEDTIEIAVHHCIFTKSPKSQISHIASHIQALKQTAATRKKILPQATEVECADTALAAKMLYQGDYPEDYAVICRKNIGLKYGLHLFKENIEDAHPNKTTFGLFALKNLRHHL